VIRRLLSPVLLAGVLAATLAAPAVAEPELVTVTDTGAEATWSTPTPSDTTICIGPAGSPARRCDRQEEGVAFHHARVGGLTAGTSYDYQLLSGGVAQPSAADSPGTFTTLVPPPGRHLLDIALVSDIHVGEGCSGTAANAPLVGTSIPPCFSTARYSQQMLAGTIRDLNARPLDSVIFNADITSTAGFDEETEAKALLGSLRAPYFVARGNHDRPNQGHDAGRCGAGKDCFKTVFHPESTGARVYFAYERGGVRFIVLDSNDPTGVGDLKDADQNAFLARELNAHPNQRTFIVFHHPVTEYADTFALPPVVFGVAPDHGQAEFLSLVARHPQVSGVLNAHTHRNFVSYAQASGRRPVYLENAAEKEYPGGYSIISIYEGGWMRTFHRIYDCAFCRGWIQTTSGEYFGLYPGYTLGSLSTRNFTYFDDCAQQTPPQSLPQNLGGDTQPRPPGCGRTIGFPAGAGDEPSPPPGAGGTGARCASNRAVRVHVRGLRGARVRAIAVYVNGRRVRTIVGARSSVTVSLRGRARGKVHVELRVRAIRRGRPVSLRDKRTYRLCRARRP